MNTEAIAAIATSIRRCNPSCGAFAHSFDYADRIVAEAIRNRARKLAHELVDSGADDETVATTHAALKAACKGDFWAEKEVAGRFLSAVERLRLCRAISHHPRARRFESLVNALARGRFTRKQLAFARRLAKEAA